jgi:hypothetical protein
MTRTLIRFKFHQRRDRMKPEYLVTESISNNPAMTRIKLSMNRKQRFKQGTTSLNYKSLARSTSTYLLSIIIEHSVSLTRLALSCFLLMIMNRSCRKMKLQILRLQVLSERRHIYTLQLLFWNYYIVENWKYPKSCC